MRDVSLQYFQEKLSCLDPIDVCLAVTLTSEEAKLMLGEEVPRSRQAACTQLLKVTSAHSMQVFPSIDCLPGK